MRTTGFILTGVCLFGYVADAGQQTLAERVRRQQGPLEVRVFTEYSPVDLPEHVKGCDLIARVIVLDNGRSYLSKDERSIHSEFTAQVLDRFLATPTLTSTEKILVTMPGGTMTIEGYPVTSRESDLPRFRANEEYILLLKVDPATGQYMLPYGAQGAFRNVGGEIEQVSKDTGMWNRERGRVSVLEFTQELTRVIGPR